MADYVGQPWIIRGGGGQQLAPESPTESVYMCVRTSVSCPLHSLAARAPLQFILGSYSMENLLPPTSLFLPQPLRACSHDVFVSTVDKTGGSLGPPISPPPWGDMADEWQDPQIVHRIILVFPSEAICSSPHTDCILSSPWSTSSCEGTAHCFKKTSIQSCQKMEHVPLVVRSSWRACRDGFHRWASGEGEFFPSIIKWHNPQ